MSVEALRERYLPALAELFPRARAARVERFLATREHAATLRAEPGVGALRPGPSTAVPGLALAGAWTDTGWPATLESAVLSGHAAAACGWRRWALCWPGDRGRSPGGGCRGAANREPAKLGRCGVQDGERAADRGAVAPGGGRYPRDSLRPTRPYARVCTAPAWARPARRHGCRSSQRRPGAALLVMGFCGGLDEQATWATWWWPTPCRGRTGWGSCLRRRAGAGGGARTPRSDRAPRDGRLGARAWRWARRARAAARDGGDRRGHGVGVAGPGAGERPFAVVRVITDTPVRELTNPLLTVAGVARAWRLAPCGGRAARVDAGG